MCGRFSLDASIDVIIERYKAKNTVEFLPKEEIFPTNVAPVVINNGNNEIRMMKWGFVFDFTKNPLINARAESVDIKHSFKYSFLNKRCIIPVTGFYEWENVDGKKIKRKIFIQEDIFSLAGLYNTFRDKDGNPYEAFTIITTEANKDMKKIHQRMPVILPKDVEGLWLDTSFRDIKTLKTLLKPYNGKIIIS